MTLPAWNTQLGAGHAVEVAPRSGPGGEVGPPPPPVSGFRTRLSGLGPPPPAGGVVAVEGQPSESAATSAAARIIASKVPRTPSPRQPWQAERMPRFDGAPLAIPDACTRALEEAWSTPPRAYHNLDHLDAVLAEFAAAAARAPWSQPREVYWALCCHDAIYVAGARDNEARSAALADELAARHLPPDLDRARVRELILLTARHGALASEPLDDDDARLLDCDLAILGAAPPVFDAYDAAVAREYAHVPAAAYRSGRRAFLAGLAAAPRIFCSDDGHRRLDRAARANLTRALSRLDATPPTPDSR